MNQYLEQKDIIEYLLATDVYVTPYLDPNQITSGTLSYALGAGKAVVSTPYLHAKEALAEDRGILVDFRSAEGIADGDQRDPRRPEAEGAAGDERLRVRERGHLAEDGRAVHRPAMQELVDEHAPATQPKRAARRRAAAGRAPAEGEPAASRRPTSHRHSPGSR